ncbi:MAG TPA: hypothetical protein DCR35_10960 [Runella sp.]|nr:hypothetical protein [Runella sp.]HAO49775.1 hypothetical protein [Runella sp.]
MENPLGTKDYTHLTLEELRAEEKKLKSQRIPMAIFVGFLVGIAIYSATHNGAFLPVILMVAAFIIGRNAANKLKNLQAEIQRRNSTF